MKKSSWSFILLIVLSILFWRDHRNLSAQLTESQDEVAYYEDELSSYEDALEQANSNIEDAQSYAWSSYYDMGYALDYLETVEP